MTSAHQPTFPGLGSPRLARRATPVDISEHLPVARLALDLSPAHLDRPFDYAVPASMDATAVPGVRVKVPFAGRDIDGFVLERLVRSDHDRPLTPLRRVVSTQVVLTPQIALLARAVADYYAGTLHDVLRLAVPPRHARAEQDLPDRPSPAGGSDTPDTDQWDVYHGGRAWCTHLQQGGNPHAVWTALPGMEGASTHAAAALAQAAAATSAGGRGTVIVAPDVRDVAQCVRALEDGGLAGWERGGPVATLTADQGPQARYRNFLAICRGLATVVVGTRAAAYAPVAHPGLLVCWNDIEDTHREPRAPYPHTRTVLAIRARLASAAYLIGSHTRTVEAQALLDAGTAHPVLAPRDTVRARTPLVRALTSVENAREGPAAAARIPPAAWRVIRTALDHGPVLVHVPRAGYIPVIACATCRAPARCTTCHGPLALRASSAIATCTWCARLEGSWVCVHCQGTTVRAARIGSLRTAEELGRGFANTTVRVSGAATGVVDVVDDRPQLVIATPGAEPHTPHGYAAALLLDAGAATAATTLNAGETALARWLSAASLVRAGAPVLLIGDGAPVPSNALVRWDPGGYAARELAERRELSLPPAVRVATLSGERSAIMRVAERIALASEDHRLGPVELSGQPDHQRLILRVPLHEGAMLAHQLAASLAIRSARKESGSLIAQLDPKDIA